MQVTVLLTFHVTWMPMVSGVMKQPFELAPVTHLQNSKMVSVRISKMTHLNK